MKRKGVNDNYQVGLAEEEEEEEQRLMAVCLRSRLMFCHGPLQFWLSAPDDERSYLALMRHKHNPSLCRLTRHEDGVKTDTPDLLQWLLLREP